MNTATIHIPADKKCFPLLYVIVTVIIFILFLITGLCALSIENDTALVAYPGSNQVKY